MCHFCFKVFFEDTGCPFPNLHRKTICVYVFVDTQSQDGYYNLMNMRSMKELITYGYVCVSEYVCVCAHTFVSVSWIFLSQFKIQRLSHFHHEYTSAYGIKGLDFWS